MRCIGVCVKENRFFEGVYLGFDLMCLQMRFKLSEVVNSTLAMRSGNDICRVLPDVSRNFTPSRLDSSNGISKCAILMVYYQSDPRPKYAMIDLPYRREQRRHRI